MLYMFQAVFLPIIRGAKTVHTASGIGISIPDAVCTVCVNALHVSGGFSAHHQGLKNCTHRIWYMYTYIKLCVNSFRAPDDGRKNRPKHVEH
jgi:hypothetical protein